MEIEAAAKCLAELRCIGRWNSIGTRRTWLNIVTPYDAIGFGWFSRAKKRWQNLILHSSVRRARGLD